MAWEGVIKNMEGRRHTYRAALRGSGGGGRSGPPKFRDPHPGCNGFDRSKVGLD